LDGELEKNKDLKLAIGSFEVVVRPKVCFVNGMLSKEGTEIFDQSSQKI